MIKDISLEFFKINHRKVCLTILSIMFVTFLWALWAQTHKSLNSAEQDWMALFYNISTLNCIVMPILIAVTASKLVDIEHKGNTLKLLKTLEGGCRLFNSKFICGILLMIFTTIIQGISMIALACINGYTSVPYGYFIYFILYTLLINVTLFLLQMILSFQFVNQMIALVISIAGSFLELFSLFFGGIISKIIFWGYYALLSPVRMDWNASSRAVNYYWAPIPLSGIITIILLLTILYVTGQKLFRLKEE